MDLIAFAILAVLFIGIGLYISRKHPALTSRDHHRINVPKERTRSDQQHV